MPRRRKACSVICDSTILVDSHRPTEHMGTRPDQHFFYQMHLLFLLHTFHTLSRPFLSYPLVFSSAHIHIYVKLRCSHPHVLAL